MYKASTEPVPGGLLRRVREEGRLHWGALSRVGRASIAGVGASAVLAVALGLFIPAVAERHALQARLESTESLVRVLEREQLIPPVADHLSGSAYQRFDQVVRGGLMGGGNLRVKLWNPAGEIIYSNEQRQVGERFPIGTKLRAALQGRPTVDVSDLSDAENALDRNLGDRLLELYLPVRAADGRVVGVFEVYQDFRPIASHISAIRTAVWIAVGSGLSILLVFLVSLFGATARAMARDQRFAQDRADDLAVLLQTSRALSSDTGLEQTGPEVLSILTARLGLRCAALVIDGAEPRFIFADRGQQETCPLALAAADRARSVGEEVVMEGPSDAVLGQGDSGSRFCAVAFPFRAEPGLTGALVACRDAVRPLDPRERLLVSGVASQLAVAAESAKLFSDLRDMTDSRGRLLRRLVDAQEEERRHLVGDLHDGLGQALTRILFGLRGSRARLPKEGEQVVAELARLESLTEEQSRNLRRYLGAIKPALLEDFGLSRAVEAFARDQEAESGIRIDSLIEPLPELEPAVAVTLFRAVQEAVINARKHAEAGHVWIHLAQRDGTISLEVKDDGRGQTVLQEGTGLAYMKDRVASLGGLVEIESGPKKGTTISARVPVEIGYGEGSDPHRR